MDPPPALVGEVGELADQQALAGARQTGQEHHPRFPDQRRQRCEQRRVVGDQHAAESSRAPGVALTLARARLVSLSRRSATKSLRRVARSTVVVVGAVFALRDRRAWRSSPASLAPYPPDEQNFDLIEARPSAQALFGTDRFGRDVLSRVIHGARISLYVAVTSIGLAMAASAARSG